MLLARSRFLFLMAFLAGTLVLGVSLYLEYVVGLAPCSLCLVQRFFLILFTVICLIAAIHGPGRSGCYLYWLASMVSCLAGMVSAWRHVLQQSGPAQQWLTCSSGLERISWPCAFKQALHGADCAHISWTLFDMSIPEWSLLFFFGMLILCVFQLLHLLRSSFLKATG
jgi:disulfide bond formation protein DsbB